MAPSTEVMNLEALAPSADPPLAPSEAAGIAQARLGEYRLLREVGRGAMGVVYEAVQESLGRRVALKVLPPGLAVRGAFRERFRREAQVAGRLHHTNIVPVHGSGEHDGSYFYAMQFIEGQSLDAVLEDVRRLRGLGASAAADATSFRGGLSDAARSLMGDCLPAAPPSARSPVACGREELVGPPGAGYYRGAARFGLQAAEALAYAHGQGVLHRDVKPSNLLIDGYGTLWVSDFGLAKADEDGDLTALNDLVGTLRYMAPERFQGRADARSDVYSLGATLYEMLTLRPAFEETDRLQLIAGITQRAPAPPRQTAPDVPRDLETIVLKAMARDPADRYASAAALAEDLRRFLDDRLILARRASTLERLRRWRRRSPATAALALSVAVLLLLLAAGSSVAAVWQRWANGQLDQTNGRLAETNGLLTSANVQLGEALEKSEKLDAEKAAANDELKKRDTEMAAANKELKVRDTELTAANLLLEQELWTSLYKQARASRFNPGPGRRFDGLDALKALRQHPGYRDGIALLRTEAVACLTLTDLRPRPKSEGSYCPVSVFDMDFDDKLERCVSANRHGYVTVHRTADDAEIASVASGFDAPSWVELSRDGRFLAVRPDGHSGRLQVWDLDGAPDRPPVARINEQNWVAFVAFAPDSRRVVVGYADGLIESFDPTTGRPERRLSGGRGGLAAAVHPDGRRLAVSDEKAVSVYDLETGERLDGWPTPSPMEGLAWRPEDGGLLASVGRDRRIYAWDSATHKQKAVMEGAMGGGIRIAFNHLGDALVGRDVTGLLRLWDPRTGRQLFSTTADMRALRFSSDDRLLAGEVDGDQMKLWDVAIGREYRTLVAEPVPGAQPEFSGSAAVHPNGRLLAAAMSDGVRFWDLDTGDQCDSLLGRQTVAVAFDATGALVAGGTGAKTDVLRYAMLPRAGRPAELQSAAPEKLPLHGAGAGLACSRLGRVTAVANLRGAEVFDPDHAKETIPLQAQDDSRDDVRDLSVSPDGRWVATCSHNGRGVRVWEVAPGAVVKELPAEGAAAAVFSPDGQWLAAGGADDCRVYAVGSWQAVGRRIEGAVSAFSPDGAMLAVGTGPGVIRLVRPETGEEYARLEDPNQDRGEVLFTPDGDRLAAVSRDGRCIHVWDLRLIRRELAERGLDW